MNLTVLFIEKSKYYISEAQKISYEDRMRHHLIVLIAPKRSERYQTFMTTQKYEAIRVKNIRALKRLYKEAGIVVSTAGSIYQLKIHQYLARLACERCPPTIEDLTALDDIRWSGCDAHLNKKWKKI